MAEVRKTVRSGETPENCFTEDVYGGMASALEVTMNAKGLYQYTAKFYFRDPDDLLERGVVVANLLDDHFRAAFPTPRGKDGDE